MAYSPRLLSFSPMAHERVVVAHRAIIMLPTFTCKDFECFLLNSHCSLLWFSYALQHFEHTLWSQSALYCRPIRPSLRLHAMIWPTLYFPQFTHKLLFLRFICPPRGRRGAEAPQSGLLLAVEDTDNEVLNEYSINLDSPEFCNVIGALISLRHRLPQDHDYL